MSTNGSDLPVILSFALTPREWAGVAASLMMIGETIKKVHEVTGKPIPERVTESVNVSAMFSGMIRDEIERIG